MGRIKNKIAGWLGYSALVPSDSKPKAGELATTPTDTMGPFGLPMVGRHGSEAMMMGGGTPFCGGGLPSLFNTAYPGLEMNMCGGFFRWSGTAMIFPRKGSYFTYRAMDNQPTLKLIRSLITGPIMASQWQVKTANEVPVIEGSTKFKFDATSGRVTGVPQSAIDMIKDQILPMRRAVLSECLRYLSFGWRPFERVYELRKGPDGGKVYVLKKLKPLLPDRSMILQDPYGNFAGITTATMSGEGLAPNKSWICTSDGEAGNLYGYSRHEAAFDPWIDWNYARIRAAMLAGKLSGNLPIIKYRPGSTPIGKTTKDNGAIALEVLQQLYDGKGVAVPTTEYSDDDLQQNPELAKLAPWTIEIVDAGSYAPAVAGIISEREYADKNLVRAWGWPERAAIEAQHGTRADAEQHTDSSSVDRELIDDDIADQLSQGQPTYDVPGVIDELLALNFGEETRGSVVLKPAPLVDSKVQIYTEILEAALANPSLAPIFLAIPDWDDILSHLDVATADGVKGKINDLIKAAIAQQQQQAADAAKGNQEAVKQATGAASNNRVSMNGNGKPPVNGRLAATN